MIYIYDLSTWLSVSPPADGSAEQHHTKSCTSCLGALKRVNQLLLVAKASAAASSAWVRERKGARVCCHHVRCNVLIECPL